MGRLQRDLSAAYNFMEELLHFIAPYGSKAEYDIWESSQAKRNIKEGIVSVWWNCEYLYGRNHFKSLLSMPTNT